MVVCLSPVNTDSEVNNMDGNPADIINLLSDLEEGELEDISDVSSDEELLLRQRIEILQNYNSVLEKKNEQKRMCEEPIKLRRRRDKKFSHSKHLRKKRRNTPIKGHVSKHYRHKRRDSSSESDVSYRKHVLREAIAITNNKVNQTSLKNRLFPLMKEARNSNSNGFNKNDELNNPSLEIIADSVDKECLPKILEVKNLDTALNDKSDNQLANAEGQENVECLNRQLNELKKSEDIACLENNLGSSKDEHYSSEDDAELLRELALNSKSSRKNVQSVEIDKMVENTKHEEENNDVGSDTDLIELRINALRSAIMKKANNRKRKRRGSRKKRNSKLFKSIDIFSDLDDSLSHRSNDGNTDIEQVDMDVDPDSLQSHSNNIFYDNTFDPLQSIQHVNQEPSQNYPHDNPSSQYVYNDFQYYDSNNYIFQPVKQTYQYDVNAASEPVDDTGDNQEEDEDVLRAKLLNSITSHNSRNIAANISNFPGVPKPTITKSDNSNLIIRLGESDLESDCEETKQLTLTYQKVQMESAFQRNLDMFLKSARSKVENTIPNNIHDPEMSAVDSTLVAKKQSSTADEYQQLVQKIAELKKLKKAEQEQGVVNNNSKNNDVKNTLSGVSKDIPKVNISSNAIVPSDTKMAQLRSTAAQSNIEIIEKYQKTTKIIGLHLGTTRKKILNHTKLMKQLEVESRNLKLKYINLKRRAQEIETAMKTALEKLSDNQRLTITTNKIITKLRKNEDVLNNKLKDMTSDLNTKLKQNTNQSESTYATKITMKNKVINKKVINSTKIDTKPTTDATKAGRDGVKTVDSNSSNKVILPKKTDKSTNVALSKSNVCSKQNSKDQNTEIGDSLQAKLEKTGKVTSLDNSTNNLPSTSQSTICTSSDNISTSPYNASDSTLLKNSGNDKDKLLNSFKQNNSGDPPLTDYGKKIKNPNESCELACNNSDLIKVDTTGSFQSERTEVDSSVKLDDKGIASSTTVVSDIPNSNCDIEVIISEDSSNKHSSSSGNKLIVKNLSDGDYKSPLQALKANNTWSEDAQAIFCPFEVGGSCKDPECKYIHPKSS